MGFFCSEPDEATNTAALRALKGQLRFWNETAAWINQPSASTLDAEQASIDRLSEWVTSIKERDVRAAYRGWLEFAQHGLDEARKEMKTQSIRKSQDEYRAKNELSSRAATERLATMPRPPTPTARDTGIERE